MTNTNNVFSGRTTNEWWLNSTEMALTPNIVLKNMKTKRNKYETGPKTKKRKKKKRFYPGHKNANNIGRVLANIIGWTREAA